RICSARRRAARSATARAAGSPSSSSRRSSSEHSSAEELARMCVDVAEQVALQVRLARILEIEEAVVEPGQQRVPAVADPVEGALPGAAVLRDAAAGEDGGGAAEDVLERPRTEEARAEDRLVHERAARVEEELVEAAVLDLGLHPPQRVHRPLAPI